MASSAAFYDCNTNTEASSAVKAFVGTARGVREVLGEGQGFCLGDLKGFQKLEIFRVLDLRCSACLGVSSLA